MPSRPGKMAAPVNELTPNRASGDGVRLMQRDGKWHAVFPNAQEMADNIAKGNLPASSTHTLRIEATQSNREIELFEVKDGKLVSKETVEPLGKAGSKKEAKLRLVCLPAAPTHMPSRWLRAGSGASLC